MSGDSSDSNDRMHAVRPGRELAALIEGMQSIFREIGAVRSELQSIDRRITDHRDARDRDDTAIRGEIEGVKQAVNLAVSTTTKLEERVRAVEVAHAASTARFGYVAAALAAVSLIALGALLKALHIG